MRHCRLFNTVSEFNEAYNGEQYEEPWVSVTDGDASGRVNYNKTEREKLLGTQLTFKITSGGNIKWKANRSSSAKEIQYSINGGEWTSVTSTTAGVPISVAANDVVKFKSSVFPAGNSFTYTTAGFELDGNIMSLGGGSGFASLTEIAQASAFTGLFWSCTGLTDASKLLLPATTLANYCYSSMFSGCTSLTTAPELPATTLAERCYYQMFQDCTSLTTAPAILPATTLADCCCVSMFQRCRRLTTAPQLPATTLAKNCYQYMFSECTSLTTAPELPAMTSVQFCYNSMFSGCTSLTTAPELPATTLVMYCYAYMFQGCTSLTTAPAILPATTLATACCHSMFAGCTNLTTTPALPATTLADGCYYNMFQGCTSLTTAPELPSTTLAKSCYYQMFNGCTSLNYIKAMFTTTPSTSYTSNWVSGVASSGTFVKNSAATWNVTGNDGVPTGWTVETASE